MHEHLECEHEFKYCSKCDAVYCEKCKQEWTKKINYVMTYGSSWIADGTLTVPCIHES